RLHAGALAATLTTRDGLPSDDVRTLHVARDGAVWIGTFHGLVRWKAGKVTAGPAGLDGAAVHAITEQPGGDLWCATDKGLAHLRGDSVEILDEKRLGAGDIQAVLYDRDGNLWFGTGAGVARITADGALERLPNPDVLILALFE